MRKNRIANPLKVCAERQHTSSSKPAIILIKEKNAFYERSLFMAHTDWPAVIIIFIILHTTKAIFKSYRKRGGKKSV